MINSVRVILYQIVVVPLAGWTGSRRAQDQRHEPKSTIALRLFVQSPRRRVNEDIRDGPSTCRRSRYRLRASSRFRTFSDTTRYLPVTSCGVDLLTLGAICAFRHWHAPHAPVSPPMAE